MGETFSLLPNNYVEFQGKKYKLYTGPLLEGQHFELDASHELFPAQLKNIPYPPKKLYLIGNPSALKEGLAIIGARKATPYGLAATKHFAEIAALKNIPVISGGAYGCDSQAHRAALEAGGETVVFLGGGCDQIYPAQNYSMYRDIISAGGAIVSERPWGYPALPFTFRQRNRLIAGCSKAVLIVEAGFPSGTFSTADEALAAGKEVLVVPGAITSKTSAGSNKLLYQGAIPVVDSESFEDILSALFGTLKQQYAQPEDECTNDPLLEALLAQPMTKEDILSQVKVAKRISPEPLKWLYLHLIELEAQGIVARFPDGRYGPAIIQSSA